MATVPPPPAGHASRRAQDQSPWAAPPGGPGDAADDGLPPVSASPPADAAPVAAAAAAAASASSGAGSAAAVAPRTPDPPAPVPDVPRDASRRAVGGRGPEDVAACDIWTLDSGGAKGPGGPGACKPDGPHDESRAGPPTKAGAGCPGGEGRAPTATESPPPDARRPSGPGDAAMRGRDDAGACRKRSRGTDGERDSITVAGRPKREEDYAPRDPLDVSRFDAGDAAGSSDASADAEETSSLGERKSADPQKLPPGQAGAGRAREDENSNPDQLGAAMPSTRDPQVNNNDGDAESSSEDEDYKKCRSDDSSGDSSSDDGDYAGQAALIASILQSQNNPALRAYLAQLHSLDATGTEEVIRPPAFPDGPPSFPGGMADFLKSPQCKSIVVLSGAGMSVASGIPDFRSAGTGLYDTLRPELLTATGPERDAIEDDPTLALDRGLFLTNPLPMLETKRGFILGTHARRWRATLAHRFVALLHAKLPGKLTRVYTQNIDGLEAQCDGLPREKVVCVHGSMASAACEVCGAEMNFDEFCSEVRANVKDITGEDAAAPRESTPIVCGACGEPMVKPTIVLFRGSMPNEFHKRVAEDLPECDLLIIIGTSLTVAPANSLVYRIPPTALRLVMNNERVGRRLGIDYGDDPVRDVYAHGHSDETCLNLAEQMGWLEDLAAIVDDLPESSAQLLRERLDRRRQSEKTLPEMK